MSLWYEVCVYAALAFVGPPVVHCPDVRLQVVARAEGFAALLALEVPPPLVHCPDVPLQVAALAEGFSTVLALEGPPPLVHFPDM